MAQERVIVTAGGIVYGKDRRETTCAVVRSSRTGMWGLPKGKMKPSDKSLLATALREVQEETGCLVEAADYAGEVQYMSDGRSKLALYWHMHVVCERYQPLHEDIEEVIWLNLAQSLIQLDRDEDREFLRQVWPKRKVRAQRLHRFSIAV